MGNSSLLTVQESPEIPEFRDIVLPGPSIDPLIIGLLAGAIILLCVLGWWLWRTLRPSSDITQLDPESDALEDLENLRSQLGTLTENQLGLGVAAIIRKYLRDAHGDEALFQTTEEMANRTNEMRAFLSEEEINHVQQVCECCDYIKFAGAKLSRKEEIHILEATKLFLSGGLRDSEPEQRLGPHPL